MKKLRADRRAWLALKWSQIKDKAVSVWAEMNDEQRTTAVIMLRIAAIIAVGIIALRIWVNA